MRERPANRGGARSIANYAKEFERLVLALDLGGKAQLLLDAKIKFGLTDQPRNRPESKKPFSGRR